MEVTRWICGRIGVVRWIDVRGRVVCGARDGAVEVV